MKKILVIDDEKEVTALIALNLKKKGYEVICANSGREGIDAARREKPDLITLDVLMPGLDGIQVLSEIKADPLLKSIPVIMISAFSSAQSIPDIESKIETFMEKPVNYAELEKSIEKVLPPEKKDGLCALVIDDEKAMAEMTRSYLNKCGLSVISACSGREGVEAAVKFRPDIIVLDLLMPVMDGFEVLEELKKNPATAAIPVIILTTSISDRYREKCFSLGAAGYLDKLFPEEILVKEIEKYVIREVK